MREYKRRQFLVDKSYQGRIVTRVLLICFAGLVLDLGLFNFFSYGSVEMMRWKTHIAAGTMNEIVWSYLVYSSGIALLLTIAALYLYIRFMRRQTAGPLYRLNKDLGSAAEGNLALNIYLRGEDDFKETAAELNRMISAVRADFRLVSEKFIAIEKAVNVLEYVADKPGVALQKCQELIEHLEPLREIKR